ncbi:hypothetical protein F4777DRAFT_581299 [Nemania sp. FL0916]|nr:hypothetical protein F4777DRAFT_581299 [Nemania sp. FL0916]
MNEQIDMTAGDDPPTPSSPKDLLPGFHKLKIQLKKLQADKEEAERVAEELRKELEKQYSKQWELENKCKDHTHALEILEQTLEKSIPLEDWITPPPKLRTALEVAQKAIEAQAEKRSQAVTF